MNSLTARQFGAHARAYVESAVHAGGADLEALAARAAQAAPERALDLGTGGGHVAYALARAAGAVTAVDLSKTCSRPSRPRRSAAALRNLETVEASRGKPALSATRISIFSPAAFPRIIGAMRAAGLRQARRVLRAGAPAVFIDVVSPEAPALDTFLQAIELLRDVSHVRDYSVAEWRDMLRGPVSR